MAGLTIRHKHPMYESGWLELSNGDPLWSWDFDSGDWFAPLSTVAEVSLASLRRALLDAARNAGDQRLLLTDINPATTYPDYPPTLPVWFALPNDSDLVVSIEPLVSAEMEGDDVLEVIQPLLRNYNAEIFKVSSDDEGDRQRYWDVSIKVARRGRKIGEAYEIGKSVRDLLESLGGRNFNSETLWNVLASGRADLLVGQPETVWFEVKSQAYTVDQEAGKIELAQDVARFANSEFGGILALGLRTRRRDGIDRVDKVVPISEQDARAVKRRYRAIIDQKVFPPIDGLRVECSATEEGSVAFLQLPPQLDDLKPFLVHGVIVHGIVEGGFISIVRRRDEHSIPISGPAIHAWLAAGRALLRRGLIPEASDAVVLGGRQPGQRGARIESRDPPVD